MGMRSAINEMCRGCVYDKHASGNWRQQVEACGIVKCPLYEYRPKSKPRLKKAGEEQNAAQCV